MLVVAEHDPELRAQIVRSRPLVYTDAAPSELDRPDVVRAASGIASANGALYVVQDDAAFIAVLRGERVEHVELPAGPNGRRRFEKALGNKLDKLDLEACVTIGDRVIAIGSGSLPVREKIAIVEGMSARLFDGSALYARMRARPDFAGSELNIEGAAVVGSTLRIFQRGNGAGAAVNATCDLSLDAFVRWIDGRGAVPEIANVRQYDLGRERGVAYGFTDAAALGDRKCLFAAGAEDCVDVIEDGEVLGARLGVIDEAVRWAPVLEPDGSESRRKIEGIVLADDRVIAVVDADDPELPAELCELVLTGPW